MRIRQWVLAGISLLAPLAGPAVQAADAAHAVSRGDGAGVNSATYSHGDTYAFTDNRMYAQSMGPITCLGLKLPGTTPPPQE